VIARLAASVGKGLFAGALGTGFMTASSTFEMKVRARQESSAPGDAAAKVLGVEPTGEKEKQRFASIAHWGYGTSWGAVRGLIGAAGITGPAATMLHFAAVWGTSLVMLPSLGISPPVTQQSGQETGIDAWHHLVYAVATDVAYEYLDR
jgi:hypothetical protein